MSWLFSRALVEACLGESSSDGEPSAPLNVMPTPHRYWHNGKTMEASNLSQFGVTCKPLTEDRGAELLTLYLAGFHARTSAAPERAPALTVSAADYGARWPGLLARFDPATFSWRTPRCSLFEDLEPCLETWPRWGFMLHGACWPLPMLAPRTDASESGLLPTPTLVSCEHPGRQKIKPGQQTCISAELAKRDGWAPGGKWSPSHAAWLMGWPVSWTSLGHSVTDKYRQWLRTHGAC